MTASIKFVATAFILFTLACTPQVGEPAPVTPASPNTAQAVGDSDHSLRVPLADPPIDQATSALSPCGPWLAMPTPPEGMIFKPTTDEEFARCQEVWFDVDRTPFMSFSERSFGAVSGSCTFDSCTRHHLGKHRVRGSYEATRWSSLTGNVLGLLVGEAGGITHQTRVEFDAGVSTHDLYLCGDGEGSVTFMARTTDYQEPGKVLWRLCEFKFANYTVSGACGEMIAE